ncbi:MAG: TIGR03016 family PEP-CTERM system-associated outer membrane protein [Gammaproteobacteria bacterium]
MKPGRHRRSRAPLNAAAPALALLALIPGTVAAGQWDITPRFYGGETYSDNIGLDAVNPRSDFVTELTPGISVRGGGARLSLDLDYNLQNLIYADNDADNSLHHQLQANATANVLKDILFLDLQSRVSQELVDPAGRVSDSNLSVTGNRVNATSWVLSPYARHRFGGYADAEVRFSTNSLDIDRAQSGSSTSDHYSFKVQSGREFVRVPWQVLVDSTSVERSNGSSNKFESVNLDVSWVFNRKYRLNATLGQESNSFQSRRGSVDGTYWRLGATWTPSPRTEISGSIGDRFFGTTYALNVRHVHRRWTFTADYQESPQTTNQLFNSRQLVPFADPFTGQPFFDADLSSRIPLSTDTVELTDEVILNKRMNAAVAYNGRRNRVHVRGYNSDRTFEARGGQETARGFAVNWSHDFSTRLKGGLTGAWQTVDTQNGITNDRITLRPYLTYHLSRRVNTTVEYLYHDNSSDDARSSYTENQFSAFVRAHF